MGTRSHTAADYFSAARGLGVERIGALVIAPRGDPERVRRENDLLLELARTDRRILPFCSVHPADGAVALAEIDRVADAGARAVKLHPNTQQFDVADPTVVEVVRRASQRGLPVLFDAYSPFDPAQAGKFVHLAMGVPEGRLILAHAHGPRFPELLVYEILGRYPWWRRNVWIDLSATAALLAGSPFAEQFRWVLSKVGIDRLLFGSDYPLDDPAAAVRAIVALGFRPSEERRILYDNASELFR